MSTYLINQRQLTAFMPLTDELSYTPDKNYLFELSHLSLLNINGKQGSTFLQGQLSCDLREVNTSQMRQGAMCNLQGRVTTLVDVIDSGSHGLHLVLPQDLLAVAQSSLTKAAAFSQVTLTAALHYQVFGFYLSNRNDLTPMGLYLPDQNYHVMSNATACCYQITPHCYILLVPAAQAPNLVAPFENAKQRRGSLAWHALQLTSHRITIYPETRGLFLPHRIDLHRLGYLSFNKGCYKGQEIIARTHFRAKLKHALKIFTIQTDEDLRSSSKVFLPGSNTEIGELIDFCPLSEKTYLVAISILQEHPLDCLIEGHSKTVHLSVKNEHNTFF